MIAATFAYSLDRETFIGNEPTRQEALRRGLEKRRTLSDPPETVYVGKRLPVDPGTSDLAEAVLSLVRAHARQRGGDAVSPAYLARVDEHALADLDAALDRTLRDWLERTGLTPTQSTIIAISEHQVPAPGLTKESAGTMREVSDLGSNG